MLFVMGNGMLNRRGKGIKLATILVAAGAAYSSAEELLPLPPEQAATPKIDTEVNFADSTGTGTGEPLAPQMPDSLVINNEGGDISYDQESKTVIYRSNGKPVHLRTDSGVDIQAGTIRVDLEKKTAYLDGPLTAYLGETLTRAHSGSYNWEKMEVTIHNTRAKVGGVLVRGSKVEYLKDEKGKSFMRIHDAYVSTDDTKHPDTWIGAGELTVYPGDFGRVTRLSVAVGGHDIPVPILGWFSFSHSLNPREGYLPFPGTKSIWGTYLLNSYGILFGNKRVEDNIPTADYLLTTHVDYRTRRGMAAGVDFEDLEMTRRHRDMTGVQLYFAEDANPMINPTDTPRVPTSHERYRISARMLWELQRPDFDSQGRWALGTNIDAVSDRYMLRDFYEREARTNDKPDNNIRLTRVTDRSELMLLTRFAPNDFYTADERTELSYYRARTVIGRSAIAYETRNSVGVMRQHIPANEMFMYRAALDEARDPAVREYYERLVNTSSFMRANSTHEFTTNFKAFGFLNIAPKAGVGYSGYYGVDGVGADNRFLGYAAVDFSFKLHRHIPNFSIPALGYKGLTHVIRPYTTLAHCSISSANARVPQIDSWSSMYGAMTSTPMELDLMGFTGIDSWGTWTIWRIGMQNTLTTTVDGESRTLLNWNLFVDYNEENPNTESRFSNLYSILTFRPTRRLGLTMETQTPTIEDGEDFSQYNVKLTYQPFAQLEGSLGYRCLSEHPIYQDAEQVHLSTNIRFNDKYSAACRWYWDIDEGRMPIQQYSVFRKSGAWYVGATLFLRDNGGKKETGFGISFTLGETGTAAPISFF